MVRALVRVAASRFVWNSCWLIATAVLFGRRIYTAYKGEGASPLKQFALRADSLPYVSTWTLFAAATVFCGILSSVGNDYIWTIGILALEFVVACQWRLYYGHGTLMCQIMQETQERLSFLLTRGLGMEDGEIKIFFEKHEAAIVDLWKSHLNVKRWSSFTPQERDVLMFDTGVECGKALGELWEGVLFDVATFFHEWRTEVEARRGSIRIPKHIAKSMISENNLAKLALLCVAVMVANEDAHARAFHGQAEPETSALQVWSASAAKRKVAAEGILKSPLLLKSPSRVVLQEEANLDTTSLFVVNRENQYPCSSDALPYCVKYTVCEAIKAGYLKPLADGTIHADITFKYGNMVFDRDQWNTEATIQRKPFQYITSAAWVARDIAFGVEERENSGACRLLNGTGYLKGTLMLHGKVERTVESVSWIERCEVPFQEGTVWGHLNGDITTKPLHILHRPVIWMIELAWWLGGVFRILRLVETLSRARRELEQESEHSDAHRHNASRDALLPWDSGRTQDHMQSTGSYADYVLYPRNVDRDMRRQDSQPDSESRPGQML